MPVKQARWYRLWETLAPKDVPSTGFQSIAECERFIKEKGDINQRDVQGYSPLHYAAMSENLKVMRWLLANDSKFLRY